MTDRLEIKISGELPENKFKILADAQEEMTALVERLNQAHDLKLAGEVKSVRPGKPKTGGTVTRLSAAE